MKLKNIGIAFVLALFVFAGVVSATPSPNGPGQPGAPGTTCSEQYPATPGNSINANSAFNPNGVADQHYAGNPGTPSLAHANSIHAVSQYDIACFQLSVN